jgi:4'-phosphopantetheinyl transferase
MSPSASVQIVDLWHVSAENIAEPRLNECLRLLAPDEAARARRYVFEQHRRQSVVAWGMLRKLLSKYTAVAPQSLVFGRNAFGKPHLVEPADSPIQFNMSHTHGIILYAVTRDCPIGVDVEDTQRRGGGIELARRFFARVEVAALETLPPQVQHDAFFRFWTLKEAYIKARGLGLSIPLQSFAFTLGDGRPPTMALTKPDEGTPNAWQFAELRLGDRHRAAVAIQCPQDAPLSIHVGEALDAEVPMWRDA